MNRHPVNMVQKVAVTFDKKMSKTSTAVNLLSDREKRRRLARELSKLDRDEEKRMAEEGIGDASWPAY